MNVQKSCRKLKTAFLSLLFIKEAEKIRVAEILTAADVSKATFYVHYENLDQLAFDIIDDFFVEMDRNLEQQNQSRTCAGSDDYALISEQLIESRDLLTAFCRTKYRCYLKESLHDYLAGMILCHQKILSGDPEYPSEQSHFFADAYTGGILRALKDQNDDLIRKTAGLLGIAVQACTAADLSSEKGFYPFRGSGTQCVF